MNGAHVGQPRLLRYRASTPFILTTVCLAVFTDYFLYGVLVPVIPFALASQSGVAQQDIQRWTSILLSLYGGTVALASPLCGYLADRASSRRLPLLLGLIVLTAGTVLLCVGSNLAVLGAGRVLQGLSGAVIYTTGPALVVETVDERNVGQAMGWIGWAMTIGTLISPTLGGLVFHEASYRAVFAMVFALIVIDVACRFLMIEKKVAIQWLANEVHIARQESTRATHTAVDIEKTDVGKKLDVNISTALNTKPNAPPSSTCLSSPPPASSILPMSPRLPLLALLTESRFLAALLGTFSQSILITSFDAVLALFVRSTFNWGPTAAGLCFLPLVIPAFCGPLIGFGADRYGARIPATLGFILATPGFICLRFVTYNSVGQKVLLCAMLAIDGLAITLIIVPIMGEIADIVDKKVGGKAIGQAYGLFNLAFGAGLVTGPIIAGYVMDRCGWSVMTLILGCFSAGSAVVIALWTGSKR